MNRFESIFLCGCERGDDDSFGELPSSDETAGSQFGQVVAVSARNFFEQSVCAHATQAAPDLVRFPTGQVLADAAGGQAADLVFAAQDGRHELEILFEKEVHSAVAPALGIIRPAGDGAPVMALPGAVRPLADKGEVAAVDRPHGFAQGSKAHECLAHRCILTFRVCGFRLGPAGG